MERRKKKNDRSSKLSLKEKNAASREVDRESPVEPPKGPPSYLRYSGLAFEMVATIGIATYGGYLLDGYLGLKFPAFLLSFALGSLAGSMYLLIKRLPKD